ncbi:MAG: polyprenyl synthetase family protein [Wenzhouxiangella sp.]
MSAVFQTADPDAGSVRQARQIALTGEPDQLRELINARLQDCLQGDDQACFRLVGAMRHAAISPGKRVRPLLAMLTALDFGRDPHELLEFACALELVHCASLALDDLPCMDDAPVRRGRNALHREYDQATATLAAVALLNHAYGMIAAAEALPADFRNELVTRLSTAVGTAGLVSGQSRDLLERTSPISPECVERINYQKTAVLFELAVVAGGRYSGVSGPDLTGLNRFARQVGLAFQAADDLLDSRAHAARIGVTSGKRSGLDRSKAGSVHALGETALVEQIRQRLGAAEAELDRMQVRGRHLCNYVRALFQRYC